MKRSLYLIAALLLISALSLAQDKKTEDLTFQTTPMLMSYQGIVTDQNGTILPDNTYALTFKIYDALTGGNMLWQEMQVVQVSKGLFNVLLGNVTPLSLNFDMQYYLGITVPPGSELTPRILLSASPYSFMTKGILDNSISTAKLQDGSVTQVKLASGISLPPGGTAGGDLTGTYPNPTVSKLLGRTLNTTAPTNGQVLSWNGTQWTPTTPSSGMGGSGTAGYIPAFTGANTIGNSIIQQFTDKIAINRPNALWSVDVGNNTQSQNYMRLSGSQSCGILLSDDDSYQGGLIYEHFNDAMFLGTKPPGGTWDARLWVNSLGRVGIGTMDALGSFHVESHNKHAAYFTSDSLNGNTNIVYCKYLGTGMYDARGFVSVVNAQDGYGIGADFTGSYTGVNGNAPGGAYSGSTYGVYGFASGNGGNRYGVTGYVSGSGSGAYYAVYALGDLAYTGNLVHPSDQKLKSNISSFTNSLEKLMQLEPKTFTYTDDNRYKRMNLPSGTHYGLIAQDLEKVFPEMVKDAVAPSKNADGGKLEAEEIRYKGVMMTELIPVLIQAIKEQEQKIEKLEKELEALKK